MIKLVVDANILFAVLIKSGLTEKLFFRDDIKLFAPEYIFDEFAKYETLILNKTSRNRQVYVL